MLIRRLQAEELDLVAPVWESLLAHHGAVAPAMATRPPGESWPLRRAMRFYERRDLVTYMQRMYRGRLDGHD